MKVYAGMCFAEITKCGHSERGRTQQHANERKRAQMSAEERLRVKIANNQNNRVWELPSFSQAGEGHSANGEFSEHDYRRGNSVKRLGSFSEPLNSKVSTSPPALILFPQVSLTMCHKNITYPLYPNCLLTAVA